MQQDILEIKTMLSDIKVQLDRLEVKVTSTQIMTADTKLGDNISFLLGNAVRGDEISLEALYEVRRSLKQFRDVVDGAGDFGRLAGLELSPIARARVTLVIELLRGSRMVTWQAYNELLKGSPEQVLSEDLLTPTYQLMPDLVVAHIVAPRSLKDVEDKAYRQDYSHRDNKTKEDARRAAAGVVEKGAPINSALARIDAEAARLALELSRVLPSTGDLDLYVRAYLQDWLGTDAARLWRLRLELDMAIQQPLWERISETAAQALAARGITDGEAESITGYLGAVALQQDGD